MNGKSRDASRTVSRTFEESSRFDSLVGKPDPAWGAQRPELPHLAGFANGMVKQFAATFLPGPLVYVTGCGIAIGEAVIGTLLLLGLLCRPALVLGTLLMLLLIFGSTLIQQWEIVSVQMIDVAFYAGLLATIRYDRFSLDGLRQRK
jgi:thiosulfate dehydrogenase [quinone] large subunit